MPSDSLADLDHPDSVWNRAAASEAERHADPLCCRSEWQLSFHENMTPSQEVVVRTSSDSIVALAISEHESLGRILTAFDWSWRFGFPALGPDAPALLREALHDLAREGSPPSVMLTALMPGSPHMLAWLRMFGRWKGWLQDEQQCSVASLEGGVDGFLSRRSGLMRRNLRKAALRAGEAGITFERCRPRNAEEAAVAWARIYAVESRSWKGKESTGVLEPVVVPFYSSLLARLARAGMARVVFARHEGEDIGFLFGGLCGGVFRAQQCSFDDAWRTSSLGNLLQMETVRWICGDGAALYHMGPTMEYKLHWAEEKRTMQSVLFVPG